MLGALVAPHTSAAQEASPTATSEELLTPKPVPETLEAVADVRAAIEADLKEATTQPVQPADGSPSPDLQQAVNREKEGLRQILTEYLQTLEPYGQTLATIRQLQEQASREQTEAEITRLQTQAAHYRKIVEEEKASPRFRSRDELDHLEVESERVRAQRDTLPASQTKRDQELDQFEAGIRQATAALTEAEAALAAHRTTPTTQPASQPADEAARRESGRIRERRLVWSTALAHLRLAALRQQRAQLQLEFDRDEPLLAALEAYAEQLEGLRSLTRQSAADLELKRIQQRIGLAKTDTARLYWQAREKILQARSTLNLRTDSIRRRYPQATLDALNTNVGRRAKSWTRFVEGLSRQERQVKRTRYRDLQKEIRTYSVRLRTLESQLGEAERDAADILLLRDSDLGEIDRIVSTMAAQIGKLDNAADRVEASKLRDELTTDHLPRLRETLSQAEVLADEAIARLAEAIQVCRKHTRLLTATSDALYWSHILAPGVGWFNADFVKLRAEWRTLPALWRSPPPEGTDAPRLASVRTQIAEWVEGLPSAPTITVLAVALAGSILAYVYRRRAIPWADARVKPLIAAMKENQAAFAPLTERLLLQGAWVGTGIAVWLVPVLVLLIAVKSLPADTLGAMLATTVLWYLFWGGLCLALVRFAFGGDKSRFRIVPCSNAVAAYYRRWLRGLIGFVLLTMPFTLFLGVVDALPELRLYAIGLIRGIAALGVLLFLRNRQTVVRVVGRIQNARYRQLYSVLVGLYPLGFLIVLTLFVLRVAGYGALADFVIASLWQTLAALLSAMLLTRVVREVTGRVAEPREAREPSASPEAEDDDTQDEGSEVAGLINRQQFARVLSVLARGIILLGAVLWIVRAWGVSPYRIQRILRYSLPLGGNKYIALNQVILAVGVVVLSVYVSRIVRRQLYKRVFPRYLANDRGAQAAVSSLVHYAIVLVGLYYALLAVGVTLGAVVVLLGGLGLGLGLGLQPLIVNFISGLLIFFERHMKVGDIVQVGGQLGEVTRINMRSTTIKTFDNIDIVIPNGDFINSAVTNWTLNDRLIRGQVDVGVAYGSNTDQVRELLLQAARENPKVLPDPPPAAWFVAFGDSSLNFSLMAWFANAGDRWAGMAELRHEIDRLFRQNKIEIPFPQRTLTVGGKGVIPIRLVREEPSSLPAESAVSPPTPSKPGDAEEGAPGPG